MEKYKALFEEMGPKQASEVLDDFFDELLDIYYADEPGQGIKGRIWRTLHPDEMPGKVTPITLFMRDQFQFEKEYGEEEKKKSLARQRKRHKRKQDEQKELNSRLAKQAVRLNEEKRKLENEKDDLVEEYMKLTSSEREQYFACMAEDVRILISELQQCSGKKIDAGKLKSFCLKNGIPHNGYEGL